LPIAFDAIATGETSMYPLPDGMFAPQNQWYVAALSSEVTRQPMERWILNEPVALYRKTDGSAVAMQGRCPHRHFPLGKSNVVGDNIECGYHGLQFRPDGSGDSSPAQKTVPASCRVKVFPLVERWKWLWIWPGNPALADPSLIPDHDEFGLLNGSFVLCGDIAYNEVPARYMLIHDNLFDLTHLNVLHRNSIGGGNLAETKEQRNLTENRLTSHRHFRDLAPPPFMGPVLGYNGLCDRDMKITFCFPGLHYFFDTYSKASGEPGGGEHLGAIMGFHCVTPATHHTSHYFAALLRDFARDDAALGQHIASGLAPTLQEDIFATGEIEKTASRLSRLPAEILLNSDTTCGLGRRMFAQAIGKEMAV
jgi:phenylpropionate dioxygenase-like ring-hydroxylating dioxygenase large terminal subunit